MNPVVDKLKQYPIAVLGTLILILCLGAGFMRGGVIAELSTHEAELVARLSTINENLKNSKDLEQQLSSLEGYISSIDERLFSRRARSINTAFFYSFEDKLDIFISDVSQLSAEDPALIKGGPHELKLYSGISYKISASGTFQEILGFIYEIYKADSLMRVVDLQLDVATGHSAVQGTFSARLRVIVLADKDE